MLKKINDLLSGTPMTMVSGIFLLFSFTLPRAGIRPPVDPAWLTVIISGIPLLYLAVWRLKHNPGISKISSALLITIAMFAAIAIGDLFAAGEVVFIMAVGAILEDMTTNRAKKGLNKLIDLAPTQARKLEKNEEVMIPADQVQKGDLLRILPGEVIPADGMVIRGDTSVDQSVITGESLPVDKETGDEVFCGTINRFGAIDISVKKNGADSSLQKLIRMVQEAEEKQAPMQRIADRAASCLVPIALLIAVIAGLYTRDIIRAVTVLVVFCPCALVLATPTAIMAAIGQATKHGIIIKSGAALEKLGKVDTIAFDKTGTLTWGRLNVSDIVLFDTSLTQDEFLALAASAENKSEHPLGQAIVSCAAEKGLKLTESTEFSMIAGKGISAQVAGKKILCGNEKFVKENQIFLGPHVESQLEKLQVQGKASILIIVEKQCAGIIGLSDILRPEAADMVSRLKNTKLHVLLLTGDNEKAAGYFAGRTGITEICAELLPEEKVSRIEKLQQGGHCLCMIGDGVNDAPALKTASVGVAMGSIGSDIAVDAADIALMNDDIAKIPYLKRLANATVKTIKFSITLSMCINFAAVFLSVAGILTPTTGALVHNAGSCLVVLIAALLYDRKLE